MDAAQEFEWRAGADGIEDLYRVPEGGLVGSVQRIGWSGWKCSAFGKLIAGARTEDAAKGAVLRWVKENRDPRG